MEVLDLTEGIVHSSTNYDGFKKLVGNRPVNQAKVKQLVKSMRVMAVDIPIILNEAGEVVDGQHRLEARKTLGLPVLYTVCHGATDVEAQHVNKTGSLWKLNDHIARHIANGNQDYQIFQDFLDKHKFGTVATHMLLTNKGFRRRAGATEAFREGLFQVDSLELAELYADRLTGLGELGAVNYKHVVFVEAFLRLFHEPVYDHAFFLGKLNRMSALEVERLLKGSTAEVILASVRRAYNKNIKNKEKQLPEV